MTHSPSFFSKFSSLCRKAFARPGSTAKEPDAAWPQEPTVYSGAWSATGLPGLLRTLQIEEMKIGARDILFAHADFSEKDFLDDREHWVVLASGPQLWLSHQVWGETAGHGDMLAVAVKFKPKPITQAALLQATAEQPWAPLLLSVLEQREMAAELRAQKAVMASSAPVASQSAEPGVPGVASEGGAQSPAASPARSARRI